MAESHDMGDGEFFALILLARGEPPLAVEDYYDPDPDESEAIRARREDYCRLFDPHAADVERPPADCFHRRDAAAPPAMPDLVHRRLAFRCPAPRHPLPHYLDAHFHDFADPGSWYQVVSHEWRRAIESVEPGKHEFFPLDVEFLDRTIALFIFRDRQTIPVLPARRAASDAFQHRERNRLYGRRSMLAGRHWIRSGRLRAPLVSRQLAELLAPLLGDAATLTPVRLAD